MKTKCTICGKVEDVIYEFKYLDFTFGYTLNLCHDCGEAIREHIREKEEVR